MSEASENPQRTRRARGLAEGGRPPGLPVRTGVLRKRREALGLTRADLAARCAEVGGKVSVSSIEKWEAGLWRPTLASLAALCAALELDAEQVIRAPRR